jgi:hypothetical protein
MSISRDRSVRLSVEPLEDRSVPSATPFQLSQSLQFNQNLSTFQTLATTSNGAFFLDGTNALWFYNSGTGQFTNTGGHGTSIAAGLDASGNPECWFLDGNNQIWRYDNGVFAASGAYAKSIKAGNGLLVFADGNNELWTYDQLSGTFKATGAYASRFTVGYDANGLNQVILADGNNELWVLGKDHSVALGVYANEFSAGRDANGGNEIWFTDGNNQVWRYDQGKAFETGAAALRITGSAEGVMYFEDGQGQVWEINDAGMGQFTGGRGFSSLSASISTNDLFFMDANNEMWEFVNGGFVNTHGFCRPCCSNVSGDIGVVSGSYAGGGTYVPIYTGGGSPNFYYSGSGGFCGCGTGTYTGGDSGGGSYGGTGGYSGGGGSYGGGTYSGGGTYDGGGDGGGAYSPEMASKSPTIVSGKSAMPHHAPLLSAAPVQHGSSTTIISGAATIVTSQPRALMPASFAGQK